MPVMQDYYTCIRSARLVEQEIVRLVEQSERERDMATKNNVMKLATSDTGDTDAPTDATGDATDETTSTMASPTMASPTTDVPTTDVHTTVMVEQFIRRREEALAASASIDAEMDTAISDLEAQLEVLYGARGSRPKQGTRRAAARRQVPIGSDRLNWDEKLSAQEAHFTIDDLMTDKAIAERGRQACHQAINRWAEKGLVKKLGDGRIRKNATR